MRLRAVFPSAGRHVVTRTPLPTPVRKRCLRVTNSSMSYKEYLDAALEAANLAGSVVLEAWDKPRTVVHKGDVDLVCSSET